MDKFNKTVSDDQYALVDAIGTVHEAIDIAAVPRIVCLVPSITELLCTLGLAEFIVGRTGFAFIPKSWCK